MTLTLRLLQSQYSICENGKYVIDSDKLEFNYMATKRGNAQDKAFPTRASSLTELKVLVPALSSQERRPKTRPSPEDRGEGGSLKLSLIIAYYTSGSILQIKNILYGGDG